MHNYLLSYSYNSTRSQQMSTANVFKKIKDAIDRAPRNAYVAELHLQVIKYADTLEDISGKEFCTELGLGQSWGTEFTKMKKITSRLKEAGLKPEKI